jgi:Protein kinase domain
MTSYSDFYDNASREPDASVSDYEGLVSLLDAADSGLGSIMELVERSNLVFLVMSKDREIVAVHRLRRGPAGSGHDIISFCGDIANLSIFVLPNEVFGTSRGPAASARTISDLLADGANADPLWTAPAEICFENVIVRPVVVVPPPYINKVLSNRFAPHEFWAQVVQDMPESDRTGKYRNFVEWSRRALTSHSRGVRQGLADQVPGNDTSLGRMNEQLELDLQGRQLGALTPFFQLKPAVPSSDVLPLILEGNKVSLRSPATGVPIYIIWEPTRTEDDVEDDADLKAEAAKLVDSNSGMIMADALSNLVVRSGGSRAWANRVAHLAAERPELHAVTQSEMLLQQQVFAPVSALLYSFRWKSYSADTMVYSVHQVLRDGAMSYLDVKPDAAIKASNDCYVLCTVEVKASPRFNLDDMAKCVLLTSMSALVFRQMGVSGPIKIPFVMGSQEVARLYVTQLNEGVDLPIIRLLRDDNLSKPSRQAGFLSYLSVLLAGAISMLESEPGQRVESILNRRTVPTSRRPTEDRSRVPSEGKSQPRLQKRSRGDATGAQNARAALSSLGQILEIKQVLFFEESGMEEQSPYYFTGVFKEGPEEAQVFAKVWREGDDRTRAKEIESEAHFQKMAHECGVPCPRVVDQLTARFVVGNQELFHSLVMLKLADNRVNDADLEAFGLSLIRSVLMLHKAGILHCDIKPTNVAWNRITQVASLLDFGHAQLEQGAKSYRGTDGYTAPEIENAKAPHSRVTESYGVGKTLLKVADLSQGGNAGVQTGRSKVREVARLLSCNDPGERITLDKALNILSGKQQGPFQQ